MYILMLKWIIYVIRMYIFIYRGTASEVILKIIIIIIVIYLLNSFSVPDIMLCILVAFSSLKLPIVLVMKHNFIIIVISIKNDFT